MLNDMRHLDDDTDQNVIAFAKQPPEDMQETSCICQEQLASPEHQDIPARCTQAIDESDGQRTEQREV